MWEEEGQRDGLTEKRTKGGEHQTASKHGKAIGELVLAKDTASGTIESSVKASFDGVANQAKCASSQNTHSRYCPHWWFSLLLRDVFKE